MEIKKLHVYLQDNYNINNNGIIFIQHRIAPLLPCHTARFPFPQKRLVSLQKAGKKVWSA